jgi:hypothetical protein
VEEPKETSKVVSRCESFDETCEEAEAVRDRAVQKATKERGYFVSSISRGSVEPSKRLKTALEARCAGKVKAAEEQCEATCRSAEQAFFDALDQLEARA